MSIQHIITQLTAEMGKHKPVYRPWFNQAISALEHVLRAEDDAAEYFKPDPSRQEANLPVFRSPKGE